MDFFRKIPYVIHDQGRTRLTQFREYLQGEGRLREARAVLDQEIPLHESGVGQEKACRSLLEACSVSKTLEPTWWIAGRARLRLSAVLNALGQSEAAKEELVSAAKQLQKVSASGISNRTVLLVRLAELKALPQSDKTDVLRSWATFSEDLHVKADKYILSTAISAASDVALAILETNPDRRNRDIFWQWYKKAESINENLGDVMKVYIARQATGDIAASLFDDYGAILTWHKHFDAKYSAFNLWIPKMRSRKSKLIFHYGLKDEETILQTMLEMKEIKASQDEFWSEEGFKSSDQIAQVKGVKKIGYSGLQDRLYELNGQIDWFAAGFSKELPVIHEGNQTYRTKQASDSIGSSIVLQQDLLHWIRQASTEGILSEEDLRNILLDPRADQAINVLSLLDSLTPQTLSVRLFGKFDTPTSLLHWERAFSTLSEWLFKKSTEPESKRHYLLYQVQCQRQNRTALHSSATSWDTIAIEAQRILDLIPKLNEEVQQFVIANTAVFRNALASAKVMIYAAQTGHVFLDVENPDFRDILSLYQLSLAENRERSRIRAEAHTLIEIASLYFFATTKLDSGVPETFIETLDAAMTAFERIREGWRTLRGWDKVRKVMLSLEDHKMLQIVPWVITVLCRFPKPPEIWFMIQLAKSMGLAWLMKANAAESPPLVSNPSKPEALPGELEEIPSFSLEEVQAINVAGNNAVFVDWYNGSSSLHEMTRPIIGLLVPGEQPTCTVPNITWHEIDETARELMKYDTADLRSENNLKTLYKLNPLVEVLAKLTKPGQILVFSPFGNLHRLPLHALQCDGQTLIRRNPVVYCSSLSVLTAAFRARRAFEQTIFQDQRRFKASVFGDPPSEEGRAALQSVGQVLRAKPIVKNNFRASKFTDAIQNPRLHLVHFHGHAEFSETVPLDQSLVFNDRDLTLREIFDIPPAHHRSHHVTLLGCGSGMSKTTASNEVLGLVPSLFHAGASSTVSTLWPFSDQDAALYSRHFYEEFEDAISANGEEGAVINLAVANQRAVLKIMEQRPALYHWAPFVLNGYWMLQVSPPAREKNQAQDQNPDP